MYCCIINIPKLSGLKKTSVCFLTVSKGEDPYRSGLASWFWFKMWHEVSVQMAVRAAVIRNLDGAVGSSTNLT